jgi:HlyD family secretion protein
VKTGLKNWDWTEITEGLSEGNVVITSLEKQGVKAGARVARKPGGAGPDSATTKRAAASTP